eukprot:CFRG5669T1
MTVTTTSSGATGTTATPNSTVVASTDNSGMQSSNSPAKTKAKKANTATPTSTTSSSSKKGDSGNARKSESGPPIVVPTPKPLLYADDYNDMEGGLLQDNDYTMIAPSIPPMHVLRQKKAVTATKWVHAPVVNHSRKDGIRLLHWVKDKEKDNQHPFARLGDMVMTDVPVYTDEEYNTHIKPRSGDWTRAETDELLELCRRFDRRFIIVHDRFVGLCAQGKPGTPPVERTIEELKERYYSICTILNAHRGDKDINEALKSVPYDANHEVMRKKQLQVLFTRTVEEVEEENIVFPEIRRITQRQKRDKDRHITGSTSASGSRKRPSEGDPKRTKKVKAENANASGVSPHKDKLDKTKMSEKGIIITPVKGGTKDMDAATSSADKANTKLTKKAQANMKQLNSVSSVSTSAIVDGGDGMNPDMVVENTNDEGTSGGSTSGGRRGPSGVSLRSAKMFVAHPASANMKKLQGTYEELGVNLETLQPYHTVFVSTEKLRAQVMELIDANKGLKKTEAEKKHIDILYEKWLLANK